MKSITIISFLLFVGSHGFGQDSKKIKSLRIVQNDLINNSDSILVFYRDFDENGNKLIEINYSGGVWYKKQNWVYDTAGRLINHTTKHQNESIRRLKNSYNKNGQKTKEVNQSINNGKIISDTTSFLYEKNNLIKTLRNWSHHKESNDYFIVYSYDQNDSLVEESKYKSDSTIVFKQLFKYSDSGKLLSSYYFNSDVTLEGDTTIGVTYEYDKSNNLIKSLLKENFSSNPNNFQIKKSIIQYAEAEKLSEVNYINDTCITSIKKYDAEGNILVEQIFWYCGPDKILNEKVHKNRIMISDILYHSNGGIKSKKINNELGNLIESVEYTYDIDTQRAIRYVYVYDKMNRVNKQYHYVKELPGNAKWEEVSNITLDWKNVIPLSSNEHFYNTNGDKIKVIFYDDENRIVRTQLFYYQYY